MLSPNENQRSGYAVFLACGVLCIILFGLVASQPKAGAWISEAAEAEAGSVKTANELRRKPISPNAWTRIEPEKLVE